ncbi:MAG: transporter related protein [Nocardioidaceae bacterium]|nr:transporter related protein [Nocardioidaceae bacterium]
MTAAGPAAGPTAGRTAGGTAGTAGTATGPAAGVAGGASDASERAASRLVAGLPPTPAVWCSGLRKRYGRRSAVDDVSLEVGRGEVVGLLGPNGAGKTTVIKMLLGLVHPDAGEVMLLGRPATDPASRARVGYLPELFRYQPWLSATEVLALHVRLAGAAVTAREQLDCLELVGLAGRAGDRVGGFSKGMQQRLGLAVALVARPELVVLDEPTSALDPVGRVDVRDIVLELTSRDVAVLLNSHLIGEVERVCDRVVILDRGRVAASGTLAELLGQRQLRLQLTDLSPAAEARLAATGAVERAGDWFTVALAAEDLGTAAPDLVRDLVTMGARVHAVEPARISLEERLLGILRAEPEARPGDDRGDDARDGPEDGPDDGPGGAR